MARLEGRRIAVVEDDLVMGESLLQRLLLEGAEACWWHSGAEAIANLEGDAPPDVVVCDIRLPDTSGETLFTHLAGAERRPPFLFMTAYADLDQAVRLMRCGAGDYVTKPFRLPDFIDRLEALMPSRPAAATAAAGVLGVSRAAREIETFLTRIADQSGPVMIVGETGVGKEVCARTLHQLGSPKAPFVAVNCAAIPADLLESEIFGHERGAFTGASGRHLGYAERAGRGVLFLDEIGDMPLALQPKILRLIETHSFHRLGGEAVIPFSARIVTATNRIVAEEVAAGRFREDLMYRLDMYTVEIPPLRERPDDIGWLIEVILADLAQRGGRSCRAGALAIDAAKAYAWPGNVRELRNRLERAVALSAGDLITAVDLFPQQRIGRPPRAGEPPGSLSDVRDAAEIRAIGSALRDSDNRVQDAARLLGISRTTLWEKMRRYGLKPPS